MLASKLNRLSAPTIMLMKMNITASSGTFRTFAQLNKQQPSGGRQRFIKRDKIFSKVEEPNDEPVARRSSAARTAQAKEEPAQE